MNLRENHWFPRLITKLSFGKFNCHAVTLGKSIYFPGKAKQHLIPHEAEHVRQQHRMGVLRFLAAYYWEFAKLLVVHRNLFKAYSNISFEREARRANPHEEE